MISFRTIWILIVGCLCVGPILAPLPLLGCLGWLIKLMGVIMAGPLFVLHSSLLLGYAGLVFLKLISVEQIKLPATMSATATAAILVPTVWLLLSCSPEWVDPTTTTTTTTTRTTTTTTTTTTTVLSSFHNLVSPKGVSFAKWGLPATPCTDLKEMDNITSIYKHFSPLGPSSMDSSFLNPLTRSIFDSLVLESNKTELKTLFFPNNNNGNQQKHNDKNKKPGLLVFIHGGGWWAGHPLLEPSACHAQFAHDHGWHYAAIEYRLGAHGWSGDVQVEDVKDAIHHLVKKHRRGFDANKIVLTGSSAGAHLALLAGYQWNNEQQQQQQQLTKNRPKMMIAGVAAGSPSTSVKIGTSDQAVPSWAGCWDEARATRRFCENVDQCNERLSPLEQVSSQTPKTILVHSARDEFYTVQHSRALHKRLVEYNISHVYMEPPLMPHSIEVAEAPIVSQMMRHAMEELMQSLL